MTLKPRYADLLAETRTQHQALWNSLSLLRPHEWANTPLAGAPSACHLLANHIALDRAMAAAVEAAAVGLGEISHALPGISPDAPPEQLLESAVQAAAALDAQLCALDNHQWQRKVAWESNTLALAELVAELNADYSRCEGMVADHLGSYQRLGKAGLNGWLLFVYNELMDSIAGMSEAEIRGDAWCEGRNTYQLLEQAWAWNQTLFEVTRRWRSPDLHLSFPDAPAADVLNPYINKIYERGDMVAVADALVTLCRKTMHFIDRADPALLQSENVAPWSGRTTLFRLIYDVYRRHWDTAQRIRQQRIASVTGNW